MFATFKQIFRRTNKDLRIRILFTLGALFIFALGTSITMPGMKEKVIQKGIGFLEIFNAMSGGGLKQFSIFALGVMPYISASIVIQILQMDIIPYFKELKEMGEEGRRKISKITRYLGLAVAFIQGFFYPMMFLTKSGITPAECFQIAIILTAGTAFLLWLGDQITEKGIGNGVSLLIMAGIVNTMPNMFKEAFKSLVGKAATPFIGWLSFALFVLLYIAIIVGVIFVQEAERRIPIQYSNRSAGSYGGQQTFLPLRLNSAGVMPVIIASVIMGIPSIVARFVTEGGKAYLFINKYLTTSTTVGFIIYILLIVAFTYVYTFLTINPEELSKNLNKNGGYIPGVRPGSETKKYISKVLGRITFLGAIFIAVIAALPTLFTTLTGLDDVIKLGGTSLLIAVGVVLETYKQLESSVASRNYNNRR